MEEQVIGIVGGMGSFATLDFFKRVLLAYPAEKEWDRPRVIVDNRCTMPSRVRAVLYGEQYDTVKRELTKSIAMMIEQGATDIVLACNTSHCFLNDILEENPHFQKKIHHIIKLCAEEMHQAHIDEAYLLATEGTIATKIYDSEFSQHGIRLYSPDTSEQVMIREFIEAVKQNHITAEIKNKFLAYLNCIPSRCVILGCTELPILYQQVVSCGCTVEKIVMDPLDSAIKELKRRSRRHEKNQSR